MLKPRFITDAEWHQVRLSRGVTSTGCPSHFCGRKIYFWPWGEQPKEEVLNQITSKNPSKAALLYLSYKERENKNGN